jgi:hypothetical protein
MDGLLVIATIATCGFVFGIVATISSAKAWIELKAMQKSTHNIQYVPIDSKWDNEEAALNKVMDREMPDLDHMDDVNKILEPIS